MRDADLTSTEMKSLGSPMRLMDRQWAPCRWGCPVHADVRRYIEHVAEGRYGEAIDVIRENLPFAGVCGRVCHHPCEANCRRQDVDKSVAIRELKRFVAERQGAAGSTVLKAARQDKARVAIVGAGPAGMTAGLELAKLGYRPVVFEKQPIAGGIAATSIPRYRLPREVIQIDVEWILAHGVELRTGVEIGKDQTIDGLLKDGFAAVVIAAGLAKSRLLPLPGIDHKNVFPVLDFLRELAFDRRPAVGQDVLVIGGGNVAMDAARSALRLGPKRVRVMCLESEPEMPAWEWERTEAREEGIEFVNRRGPVEIVVNSGRLVGVKTRKVTRVFDDNKRFDPQYDDTDITVVECDTVIFAIGQAPDMNFLTGSSVTLDARKRLAFDKATQQTNLPNVFAAGEIVTPPGSVVEACANGRRAAKAVDMHLTGQPVALDDSLPPKIDKIAPDTGAKVLKVTRSAIPTVEPETRRANWLEVDHCLSEATALVESRRCMSCGGGAEVLVDKCAACLTCARVCPFGIPKITDVARIDSALCQACGMCIAECPANAIIWRSKPGGDLKACTDKALAALPAGRKIVAFHASAEAWALRADNSPAGVAQVYVHTAARVAVPDILHAFEAGADGVVIVSCRQGLDRYPQAAARTAKRVEQARQLLSEAKFAPECIQLTETAADGPAAVAAAMNEAVAKMK